MQYNKHNVAFTLLVSFVSLPTFFNTARAEFALNFQSNPNVVGSIANWGCGGGGSGGGGMGGGGMGMFGPGCGSGYFLQEVVEDAGLLYYHVILGDPAVDDFAIEFYIRAGECCWFGSGGGGRGGGGMGGGGPAPYSSSYGDTSDLLASAWLPLAEVDLVGNGTGNPNRVYMRQINNDAEMTQEFTKSIETNKPRITQVIEDSVMTSTFDLNMSNGDHDAYSAPVSFTNDTSIAGIGSFNATTDGDAPNAQISAGRYIYTADNPLGTPHGDSYGTYTYEDGDFDVYNVDWLSYCDPTQNPDLQCNFVRGGRGMGGGGRGGGRGGM